MNRNLDPTEVIPLHEPRSSVRLAELVADMKENGWTGRPLLIIHAKDGHRAWTGSHRIAAAREAGLRSIPCWVIPESRIEKYGVDARWGHVDDGERLEIMRKTKDKTAIQLMWLEGRE